jgi:hypothetical protein
MPKYPLIYRDNELIVVFQGYPYVVSYDHPNFEELEEAIADGNDEALESLLSTKGKAASLVNLLAENGIEEVYGGGFTYMGNPIEMDLSDYLYSALDAESEDVQSIVRFIQNLFENDSNDVRAKLFGFMEHNKMPITPEGEFMAFKVVRANYLDWYTGTVDNSVGVTPPMLSWSQVDTDPEITCSRGYHVCSKDYIPSFYSDGDRVVSVVVDPRDVGAVPNDYNGSKIRCRSYTVVADVTDKYIKEQDAIRLTTSRGLNPGQPQKVRSNLSDLIW